MRRFPRALNCPEDVVPLTALIRRPSAALRRTRPPPLVEAKEKVFFKYSSLADENNETSRPHFRIIVRARATFDEQSSRYVALPSFVDDKQNPYHP